jgi:hypothetical protein
MYPIKKWALTAAGAALACCALTAHAADWCGGGIWADAMLASQHIDPKESFNQFNPGLGAECWLNDSWAGTVGGFRNSLRRPSYYGGAIWAPEFLNWHGYVRLAAMGGLISGYNFGRWGFGHDHSIGPVLLPVLMAQYKHVGINVILVPPIPADQLPFTLGFQVKYKF